MSGVLDLMMSEAQATSSVGSAPNAMSWANIFGQVYAGNAAQTISGISGGTLAPITVAATGAARVGYVLNGVAASYSGAFDVQNGQTLGFTVFHYGVASGVVTVTSGATTLGSFTYALTNPGT